MAVKILKWQLQSVGVAETLMVGTGPVLYFAVQHQRPTFWMRHEAGGGSSRRVFYVVGTGHEWPDGDWEWRGTTLDPPFVWHLLERVA